MQLYNKDEVKISFSQIAKKIKKGAVFVYPTDTIYGLGCNAEDEKAVEEIRKLKNRYGLPFSVIAPSEEWILDNCEVSKANSSWLSKLPGSYTLILKLKNKKSVAKNVSLSDTLGVRIPNHWISRIVNKLDIPIVTTSANKTGQNFMTSLEDCDANIKNSVDFIIYEGEKHGRPSTIVDLTKEKAEIKKR